MTKSVLAFALIAAAFLVTGLVGGESRAQQAAPSSLDAIPDKMPFDVPYGAPISLERAQAVIATFRRETKVFENGIQGGLVYQITLDGVIGSRGGVPLVENGKLIGAIGASGGTGSQDEVCAKAAAATVK